jgi:cytochrome c5
LVNENPTSDEKIFDLLLLTIGVLVGVAVGLYVIASELGNKRQLAMQMQDPAFQAAVNERIAPFGRVVLEGEVVESAEVAAPVEEPEEAKVVLTGPQVYNNACTACHSTGAGGAPIVGDVAGWAPRIANGEATLASNAINGIGIMPPKGGYAQYSDEEITSAVQYMVEQSQ